MRRMDEVAASAGAPVTRATGRPETARQKLIPPATEALKVLAIPNTVSSWSLLRCGRGFAVDDCAGLDHLNLRPALTAAEQVFCCTRIGLLRVGDAAQRQRQALGHLLHDGDHLGLVRRELERG